MRSGLVSVSGERLSGAVVVPLPVVSVVVGLTMSLSLRSAVIAMSIPLPPLLQRQRRTPLPKRLFSQRESHGSKIARSKIGKTCPRNGKKKTGKSRLH
jgi:hypothetical protein